MIGRSREETDRFNVGSDLVIDFTNTETYFRPLEKLKNLSFAICQL